MEIFGKSLSDFKKPLLISVAVLAVILIGAFVVLNFVLNLGANITCDSVAEINFTESKISEVSNGEDLYRVDATFNISEGTHRYCDTTYVSIYGVDSEDRIDNALQSYDSSDWSTDFSYGYSTRGGSDTDRFITDGNGSIEGVVLLNTSDTARVAGLEKGDTVVVTEQLNNFGEKTVDEYTVE